MKGAETGAGLGHHVERQPGTIGFAVAVPVFQLVFAQALNGLNQAIRHGVQQVGAQRIDGLIKTIESLRKHKLEHWDRNRETNRAWLALNMMTEARAGFRAFHYGSKEQREVDFILLRRRLAEGVPWSDELIQEIAPWTAQAADAAKH